jgi:hypothetical protein
MKRLARVQASKRPDEENLQISVPPATKKSLRLKAAENGETMRVLVLKALAAAGIQVPSGELQDRRKNR